MSEISSLRVNIIEISNGVTRFWATLAGQQLCEAQGQDLMVAVGKRLRVNYEGAQQ